MTKVFIPFAQLIQNPLDFQLFSGRYEGCLILNSTLESEIFPGLKHLLLTMSEIDSIPQYPKCSPEDLLNYVNIVAEFIGKAGQKFTERYAQVQSNSIHPFCWNIFSSLMNQFIPKNA
jgi:hypothetical protein